MDARKQIISLIGFMSNKVKSGGGINLAQGIPGFDPPEELVELFVKNARLDFNQYAPSDGDLKLLQELRRLYEDRMPLDFNFMVTQGATEAVALIYQYLHRKLGGFHSLAFEPSYESYKHIPAIYGGGFTSFNVTGGIDFEELERVIVDNKIRLIFVNSPGNPYGGTLSKFEFDEIVKMSGSLDVYLLVDSVYEELYYEDKTYVPFDKMTDRIFYVNSFSKLFSITGWRVGYFAAHQSHFGQLRYIHSYTGLCTAFIPQRAIADYVSECDYGKYIAELRGWLKHNYSFAVERLQSVGFDVKQSKAGYFVWAKLPEGFKDGFDFAVELYDKERVAVVPGIHFSDNANDFVRINIARKIEELTLGIESIERFVERVGERTP